MSVEEHKRKTRKVAREFFRKQLRKSPKLVALAAIDREIPHFRSLEELMAIREKPELVALGDIIDDKVVVYGIAGGEYYKIDSFRILPEAVIVD